MAEPLKNIFFTKDSLQHMAERTRAAWPEFDAARFLALVFADGWEQLELKDRMHRTARSLHATLPQEYAQALAIMEQVIPSIRGFDVMTFPDYVEIFGQDEPERSLQALGFFTRYASGEFAVRPFLLRYPEQTLAALHTWAQNPDPNVRRLASEGCRPRLPWAMALPPLKADPSPILPILERLKDDDSEMVRRSVANNLNDISKDHPQVVLALAERWAGQSAETDKLLKHACRGLLKAGNPRALALFGFEHPEDAEVRDLRLLPERLPMGNTLEFDFVLHVGGDEETQVRLEYEIVFAKARGTAKKIFQISERRYAPGDFRVRKRHSTADMSTRKHYPGEHGLTVIVNGQRQAQAIFILEAA